MFDRLSPHVQFGVCSATILSVEPAYQQRVNQLAPILCENRLPGVAPLSQSIHWLEWSCVHVNRTDGLCYVHSHHRWIPSVWLVFPVSCNTCYLNTINDKSFDSSGWDGYLCEIVFDLRPGFFHSTLYWLLLQSPPRVFETWRRVERRPRWTRRDILHRHPGQRGLPGAFADLRTSGRTATDLRWGPQVTTALQLRNWKTIHRWYGLLRRCGTEWPIWYHIDCSVAQFQSAKMSIKCL